MTISIGNIDFSIKLHKPQWKIVCTIPKGTVLQKGRHGVYREIIDATKLVKQRFGCYAWQSDTTVYYWGSFAKDYIHGNFRTNLQGRIHNYLQNHRINSKTDRKNTNLMVFENLNSTLKSKDVSLGILVFDRLNIGNDEIDFPIFTQDADLVHAVEELLICGYRRQKQCEWNRT